MLKFKTLFKKIKFKTKKCANCRHTLGPKCPHFCPTYPLANRRRSAKKAVIVGISYQDNPKLKINGGSVYAGLTRLLLINRFSFPDDSSIRMLTEREGDILPTKQNIIWAMDWLVQGCQPQDSLVFYYFGHGSQQRNIKGEEKDGYDETLCPLDFEINGVIVDDVINETLVKPLPHGVRLHAFVDASHSGTVLDLPFRCRRRRFPFFRKYKWEDHRPKTGAWKGSSGGEVICFSGCNDDEAYNNTPSSSKMRCVGAMTICFINAIEKGHGETYGSILRSMRKAIRNGDSDLTVEQIAEIITLIATTVGLITQTATLIAGINDGGILGAILGSASTAVIYSGMNMLSRIGRQKPQLTAWEKFDVDKKPFLL